jgi:drug/metabolite transporter (DMT)-like permease
MQEHSVAVAAGTDYHHCRKRSESDEIESVLLQEYMIFLKLIAFILLAADAIIGFRFFLNVIGVLDTTKYSMLATTLYAVIFLLLAAAGFYFLFIQPDTRKALLISLGPWALMLVVMLVSLATGDYH